jgi:hypothetical protein
MSIQASWEKPSSTLEHDVRVKVRAFGLELGLQFQSISNLVQAFLDWISDYQFNAQTYQLIGQELSAGLRLACSKNKRSLEYAKNLESVVWEIIDNPGWMFMSTNISTNRTLNRGAINQRSVKSLDTIIESKPKRVKSAPVNILRICTKCGNDGPLVICERNECLHRYHWGCLGITRKDVENTNFFCESCEPQFLQRIRQQKDKKSIYKSKRQLKRKVSAVAAVPLGKKCPVAPVISPLLVVPPSTSLSALCSLVKLTAVINSMTFQDSESLADDIAGLFRRRHLTGTGTQQDLVIQDCSPVITSVIRDRLTAMIKTMMCNSEVCVCEGFQVGYAKNDSNTLKQRYCAFYIHHLIIHSTHQFTLVKNFQASY